jgi:hypothetical protein
MRAPAWVSMYTFKFNKTRAVETFRLSYYLSARCLLLPTDTTREPGNNVYLMASTVTRVTGLGITNHHSHMSLHKPWISKSHDAEEIELRPLKSG